MIFPSLLISSNYWRSLRAGLAVLALLLPSCASKTNPPVSVKGKVVRNGKGVPDLHVTFWPHSSKERRVVAVSGPSGEFSLEVPPGTYTVTINPATGSETLSPDAGMPGQAEFNQPSRTDKSLTLVPPKYQARDKTPFTVEVPADGKEDVHLEIGK